MSGDVELYVEWRGKPPGLRTWTPESVIPWPSSLPIPAAGDRLSYLLREDLGRRTYVDVRVVSVTQMLVERVGEVTATALLVLSTELDPAPVADEAERERPDALPQRFGLDRTVNLRRRRGK